MRSLNVHNKDMDNRCLTIVGHKHFSEYFYITDTKIFQHETMAAVTPIKIKALTNVIMHFFVNFVRNF
jgi:hypothetical protein